MKLHEARCNLIGFRLYCNKTQRRLVEFSRGPQWARNQVQEDPIIRRATFNETTQNLEPVSIGFYRRPREFQPYPHGPTGGGANSQTSDMPSCQVRFAERRPSFEKCIRPLIFLHRSNCSSGQGTSSQLLVGPSNTLLFFDWSWRARAIAPRGDRAMRAAATKVPSIRYGEDISHPSKDS